MPLSKPQTVVSWILQILAAGILFQTLFFKFTGSPESVHIFSTLGMEPAGRIGSAVAELFAGVFLLVPQTVVIGALIALGVISVAILSHLTKLGIEVLGDGGTLFAMACVVFLSSAVILFLRRKNIPLIGSRF